MEEIKSILQKSTYGKPSKQEPKQCSDLSKRQKDDLDGFVRKFPTSTNTWEYFVPSKWAACVSKQGNALLFPNVTLNRLDEIYGKGCAVGIVQNNLTGIFTLAEPREPINQSALDRTAELFIAKYGAELSAFGMLYYFANYLTDYRSSYGRFDIQDVLRQCGKVFLPWYRGALGRLESRKKPDEGVRGKAALYAYLRREYIAKGVDVRESNLYRLGCVTDADIAKIESGNELIF